MLASILKVILDWLLSYFGGWAQALLSKLARRKEIINEGEKSTDDLKKADPNDPKAIDDGIDKSLNGF